MQSQTTKASIKSNIINRFFGFFVGGDKVFLSADDLKSFSVSKMKVDNFGDPYFEEGLDQLISIVNDHPHLNNLGRFLIKSSLTHNLSNRLLFCDTLKRNPHIENTDLIPPVIITGLPRSGTTLLHRLLTKHEKNYGAPLWEMLRPLNEPGKKDFRKTKARIEMKASNFLKGNINHIHFADFNEPEECIYLLGITFNALLYWIQFPVYPYIDWYIRQNRDKKYQDYHRYLKILQNSHPGRRLIMKSPEHAGSIGELHKIIPGAILVETHRDPVECYNSMNSLLHNIHSSITDNDDRTQLATANMKLLLHEIDRNRQARKSNNINIIDVWYEDLLADPAGVVESIYLRAGINIDDHFRERMDLYVKGNPKDKFGAHRYNAQSFGLSDETIRDKFSEFEISPANNKSCK